MTCGFRWAAGMLGARTLGEAPPTGDSHWLTRSTADAEGMSQPAASRIWRAFGLKPHAVRDQGSRRGGYLPRPRRGTLWPWR